MERRTQLSVILNNAPGELSKLCDVLKTAEVNILAMSIQNAKDSVKELYNMREKTGRRIALAESYRGILKDSSDYSLIRLLVDRPDEAEKAGRWMADGNYRAIAYDLERTHYLLAFGASILESHRTLARNLCLWGRVRRESSLRPRVVVMLMPPSCPIIIRSGFFGSAHMSWQSPPPLKLSMDSPPS